MNLDVIQIAIKGIVPPCFSSIAQILYFRIWSWNLSPGNLNGSAIIGPWLVWWCCLSKSLCTAIRGPMRRCHLRSLGTKSRTKISKFRELIDQNYLTCSFEAIIILKPPFVSLFWLFMMPLENLNALQQLCNFYWLLEMLCWNILKSIIRCTNSTNPDLLRSIHESCESNMLWWITLQWVSFDSC